MKPKDIVNLSELESNSGKYEKQSNDALHILGIIIARNIMKERAETKDINSPEKDQK
jgi:hypothetical protein